MSKPCAFKLQGLREHIIGVERVAEAFIEASNLHRVAARRLGISNPELVKSYMLLAAKAHDLGKAMEAYQSQFDDSCSPVTNKFNFVDHEVYSAIILLAEREGVTKAYGDCDLCFNSAVSAVLLHHHAMRVHDEREITAKLKEYSQRLGRVVKDGLDEVMGFQLPESLGNRDLSRLASSINAIYGSSAGSYLYFLSPLVIADYADSSKRENSEKRTFSLIVLDILQEWGVKG